ncbi:hypothetical protein DENSPDRAFT_637526 [Dentipellis sp. KUC8613]|nr:hypothetical protein DENSPDRAFT_637526 [Dentipellis sp. KUC8613]
MLVAEPYNTAVFRSHWQPAGQGRHKCRAATPPVSPNTLTSSNLELLSGSSTSEPLASDEAWTATHYLCPLRAFYSDWRFIYRRHLCQWESTSCSSRSLGSESLERKRFRATTHVSSAVSSRLFGSHSRVHSSLRPFIVAAGDISWYRRLGA